MLQNSRLRNVLCFVCVFMLLSSIIGCSKSNEKNVQNSDVPTRIVKNVPASPDNTPESVENTAATEEGLSVGDALQDDSKRTSKVVHIKEIRGPEFIPEKDRKYIKTEWKPLQYEKKAVSYKVSSDLSNVVNLKQFGDFTKDQKAFIAKNGFVVCPSDNEQLYYIYETNQYKKLPSFVTTDSVLQMYHIFFGYSLRTLEYDMLLDHLEQLTDDMLRKSINIYEDAKDREVKAAALKNIEYFAVAQKALELELPDNMPDEAKNTADAEYKKVLAEGGFEESSIFPFELDYSQYKPRGHYTRNHDFERFFKAMMWYGQAPFPFAKKEQTIQALLMTFSVFQKTDGTPDIELWEKIYDPTVFYVGSTDDLNIYQYAAIMQKVYGSRPEIDKFADKDKYKKVLEEAKKYPQPKIRPEWVTVDTPVTQQFRFMGQRYIPDSEMLQRLTKFPERPMPKGLDVLGVLGSSRAYDLLINKYHEDKTYKGYTSAFSKLRDEYKSLKIDKWQSNMYYGWLWSLKPLLQSYGKGYPSFMTNKAWEDKSLSTALSSWSELRHDTILYGKQSGAECGGAEEEIPVIRSYVEPNIEVYERLLWLTTHSKNNLTAKGIISEELSNKISYFEELLQFLIRCSVKELKNQELSREEYNQLLVYGGTLENITLSMAEGEILSDTDKNMAVVADVHTNPGAYLEEGVGTASEIFVVVSIGGKLYLTRGAVFDYYEFVNDTRLSDEEWQKMLKNKSAPKRPDWTDSYIKGTKNEIPEPASPYFTGC